MIVHLVACTLTNASAFWAASRLLSGFRVKNHRVLLENAVLFTILTQVAGAILGFAFSALAATFLMIAHALPSTAQLVLTLAFLGSFPALLVGVITIDFVSLRMLANVDSDFRVQGAVATIGTLALVFVAHMIALH